MSHTLSLSSGDFVWVLQEATFLTSFIEVKSNLLIVAMVFDFLLTLVTAGLDFFIPDVSFLLYVQYVLGVMLHLLGMYLKRYHHKKKKTIHVN